MEMTEVFDSLKELQDVLVQKYDIERQLAEAPRQLDAQEEALERDRREFRAKSEAYGELKVIVEHLKDELSVAVNLKESAERSMDNITTHREYEALDKQIAEAGEKEKATRSQLLDQMNELAKMESEIREKEAFIKSGEEMLAAQRGAIDEQVGSYKGTLDSLASQEKDIEGRFDETYGETIYKFHNIIRRNSEGIVSVRNGVCSGCHMILPAQFANEVREGDRILFCPYCSRILFYEETGEENEEDFSALDETGSLADYSDEDFEDDAGIEDVGDEDSAALDDDSADDGGDDGLDPFGESSDDGDGEDGFDDESEDGDDPDADPEEM